MSAKILPKRDPMEKLGNVCLLDGKVTVIEYSDMPTELAEQTTTDGRLRFSAGSIAIHVISRSFAERLTMDGQCSLPLHRAEKKVAFVDPDRNVATYNKSLGGQESYEAFLIEARKQQRGYYRVEYTASAVNDYIRAGFTVK